MQGTAPGVRADPATRLAAIGRQRPEWRTWLGMLGEVLPWLDDPALSSPLGGGEPELVSSTDPLLQGRELLVDAERLTDVVHRLLKIAAMEARSGLGGYLPSTETVVDLLAAAMRHDHVAIEDMAAAAGIQHAALDTVAQVAAYPVLQSHGKLLQAHVQLSWAHGYCPICGSWPLLGEFRSLDRTRGCDVAAAPVTGGLTGCVVLTAANPATNAWGRWCWRRSSRP
jgi:hypothetical protein